MGGGGGASQQLRHSHRTMAYNNRTNSNSAIHLLIIKMDTASVAIHVRLSLTTNPHNPYHRRENLYFFRNATRRAVTPSGIRHRSGTTQPSRKNRARTDLQPIMSEGEKKVTSMQRPPHAQDKTSNKNPQCIPSTTHTNTNTNTRTRTYTHRERETHTTKTKDKKKNENQMISYTALTIAPPISPSEFPFCCHHRHGFL